MVSVSIVIVLWWRRCTRLFRRGTYAEIVQKYNNVLKCGNKWTDLVFEVMTDILSLRNEHGNMTSKDKWTKYHVSKTWQKKCQIMSTSWEGRKLAFLMFWNFHALRLNTFTCVCPITWASGHTWRICLIWKWSIRIMELSERTSKPASTADQS